MKNVEAVLGPCINAPLHVLIIVLLIFLVPAVSYSQTTQTFEQTVHQLQDAIVAKENSIKEANVDRKQKNDAYYREYGFTEDEFTDAIEDDSIPLVTKMLATGIDVNRYLSEYGYTALHLAAIVGSLNTVKLLLSKGACLNCSSLRTEFNGPTYTPLYLAVFRNRNNVVDFLLAQGASVYKQDYKQAKENKNAYLTNLLKDKY